MFLLENVYVRDLNEFKTFDEQNEKYQSSKYFTNRIFENCDGVWGGGGISIKVK